MTPEKKNNRRLRNLMLLSLLLLLVGGTYAFRSFNQQAINDREREHDVNVGGRIHDYYNRDTENKDVFVENYGERPIMARIRLSEYLETRQRDEENFTPLVNGTSRANVDSWTRWIPSANNINDRANNNASNAFDRYSNLSFGWSRSGETAPWYIPTFNQDNLDHRTAAAGHARDWIAGGGATDGATDGTTHPGEGTDGFWGEGATYTNGNENTWPGISPATHTARQNLEQERAPMTIEQWNALPNENKIGNFWVIDQQTGWAYWANQLEPGEATSYLLDAAEMTAVIEETVFNGFSYYAINVESELVSPDQRTEFLNDGGNNHVLLAEFLTGITNGVMFDDGPNPAPNDDSEPAEFDFSTMRPGRIFTMAGEQYRYLRNMGSNNHMIMRNDTIRTTSAWSFWNHTPILENWYENLENRVKEITQPVSIPSPALVARHDEVMPTGSWLPTYLPEDVAADSTRVVSVANGGAKQAFLLSLADIRDLSGPGRAFFDMAQRGSRPLGWWWLRTVGAGGTSLPWVVYVNGGLSGRVSAGAFHIGSGGIRPALIINNQQS